MLRVSNDTNFKPSGNRPSFGALNIPPGMTDFFVRCKRVGTPTQRLVIGSTALFLQPMIDLRNKKVDEKTRETAASRSMARAIVGTVTGIAVRTACYKAGDILSKPGKAFYFNAMKNFSADQLQNYSRATGDLMALGILIFTNFLVDVPYINKISAYINEKMFGNKPADAFVRKEAK